MTFRFRRDVASSSSSSSSTSAPSTAGAPLSSFLYTHGQQPRHQLVVRVAATAVCVLILAMCVVFVVLTSVPLGMLPRRNGHSVSGRERYGMVTMWDGGGVSTMRETRKKREYSFEAYGSFEEAQEDMSRSSGGREEGEEEQSRSRKSTVIGDSDDNDASRYGAVHLCATENARRSRFHSYIVIPRHAMYYTDRDVKAWEAGDARRFTNHFFDL